jgi:methylthioribulose-1-phosphate dehydratase
MVGQPGREPSAGLHRRAVLPRHGADDTVSAVAQPSVLPTPSLSELAPALVEIGRRAHARGWLPATSGNLSARIDATTLAITASGRDKGALEASDIIAVDLNGALVAQGPHRPSAETSLHCQLYRARAATGAVLHTHSRAATLLSRSHAARGELVLSDYELAKALSGVNTHDGALRLPVLGNSQDMAELSARVERVLAREPLHGYLIAGHGLYTWGKDLGEAFRHLEALEFMLECALWEGKS